MTTPSDNEQQDLIDRFCAVTGRLPIQARSHLEMNQWKLEDAIVDFYESEDPNDGQDDDIHGDRPGIGPEDTSDPERLAGSSSSGQPKPKSQAGAQKKKFATLGDLSAGGGAAAAGGADSSDNEDDRPDLFAGGEKSGLAVQDPDDLKKKIIEKAKKGVPGFGEETTTRQSTNFAGPARTLGGDESPSEAIEDPSANIPQPPERVSRTLHFWNDGFSVDDGDLYRSDDPLNAHILNGIRQGRAPISIMNVQQGQEVDVEVQQHDSNFVKPKPKYKPFSGQGQRLGSPTPAQGSQSAAAPAAGSTTATAAPAATESGSEKPDVDESQPTVTLQIRLGDGTRLTSRFNTTHTIGDVYDFVSAASPASQTRPWVLMTTFPSTELKGKDVVLGDLKDFKRGGVVVQKWT